MISGISLSGLADLWPPPLTLPLCALAAVLLDRFSYEPRRWHPLVGFGHWAQAIEHRLNTGHRLGGLLAWLLALLPFLAIAVWLRQRCAPATDMALLTFALGAQSLREHAEAVARPLAAGNLDEACQRVG